MKSGQLHLVTRCQMLAEALRGLDDFDLATRAEALHDAAELLDLLAEVLTEAGADAADDS